VPAETTWYLWDGDALITEYRQTGATQDERQARYAYAGGFAPVQVAIGSPATEAIYDVHTDHLDTPRLLTNSLGGVAWRAAYEAFGKVALDPANSVSEFNIRFPGQYFDVETGLHYNRFRYYDPSIGRYVSADPIGQEGGVNLYGYAENNPAKLVDPMGLIPPVSRDVRAAPARTVAIVRSANREFGEAEAESERRVQAGTLPARPRPGTESQAESDFRHCLASCEITRQHGSATAAILGDGREAFSSQGIGSDANARDRAANARGRGLGIDSQCEPDCEEGCADYAGRPGSAIVPISISSPGRAPARRPSQALGTR
jgi:RHS repeat-associated protein